MSEQQWIPGVLGMSVHTDCLYLQEINREPDPQDWRQISSQQVALQTLNFRRLINYQHRGRWDMVAEMLGESITRVQDSGADFLVLTANTLHTLLPQLAGRITVPVLDIFNTVFDEATSRGLHRAGLLATGATVESGIYADAAARFGAELIAPSRQIVDRVDEMIFNRLMKGVVHPADPADLDTVRRAIEWFADQGADSVILGCSDISVILPQLEQSSAGLATLPLVDSARAHARATRDAASTGYIPAHLLSPIGTVA